MSAAIILKCLHLLGVHPTELYYYNETFILFYQLFLMESLCCRTWIMKIAVCSNSSMLQRYNTVVATI